MSKYETLKLFDYSIFVSRLDQISIDNSSKCIINTLNQYSYAVAEHDAEFKQALLSSDILLPDGIGITGAVKVLTGATIKKIAGADVHLHLLKKLNESGGSCFYLGSAEETLVSIKNRLAVEFPNIKMAYYAPPFTNQFTDQENANMVAAINAFKPDILFVGMTAPKQEKWSRAFAEQLDTHIICSIGAVFDFYSGMIKRPSKFWINLGLEWMVRLVMDPNHLWKRYLVYGPVFVYLMFKEKYNDMLRTNKKSDQLKN